MSEATCASCPFWEPPKLSTAGEPVTGACHHVLDSVGRHRASDWCSEHPLRQRDQLAAMAMQSILQWTDVDLTAVRVAERAYEFADAMLAARERKEPKP